MIEILAKRTLLRSHLFGILLSAPFFASPLVSQAAESVAPTTVVVAIDAPCSDLVRPLQQISEPISDRMVAVLRTLLFQSVLNPSNSVAANRSVVGTVRSRKVGNGWSYQLQLQSPAQIFSDGSPVTPHDVASSIQACTASVSNHASIVATPSDQSNSVTLTGLSSIDMLRGCPVFKALWSDVAPPIPGPLESTAGLFVGSGAYELFEVKRSELVLRRRAPAKDGNDRLMLRVLCALPPVPDAPPDFGKVSPEQVLSGKATGGWFRSVPSPLLERLQSDSELNVVGNLCGDGSYVITRDPAISCLERLSPSDIISG